jgi:hypothetical protein
VVDNISAVDCRELIVEGILEGDRGVVVVLFELVFEGDRRMSGRTGVAGRVNRVPRSTLVYWEVSGAAVEVALLEES